MPWRRAKLRDAIVLARVDDAGAVVANGGRVDVVYKPGGKVYRAGVSNLALDPSAPILPDAANEPASEPSAGSGPAPGPDPGPAPAPASEPARSRDRAPRAAVAGDPIVAYADGACTGNPGPAGLGVVLLIDGERRELSEYLGHGTNNIAELTAILRVLEAVPDRARPIDIHTDSQYAIGVLQKGWKAKANQALVGSIRTALGERARVRLHYVPGHAGVVLNEAADRLARDAVSARATAEWKRVGAITKPAAAAPSR